MTEDEKTTKIARYERLLLQRAVADTGMVIPSGVEDMTDIILRGGEVRDDGSVDYLDYARPSIRDDGNLSFPDGADTAYKIQAVIDKKPFYRNEATAGITDKMSSTGYTMSELKAINDPKQLLSIANKTWGVK